jgi:hypothetical protein
MFYPLVLILAWSLNIAVNFASLAGVTNALAESFSQCFALCQGTLLAFVFFYNSREAQSRWSGLLRCCRCYCCCWRCTRPADDATKTINVAAPSLYLTDADMRSLDRKTETNALHHDRDTDTSFSIRSSNITIITHATHLATTTAQPGARLSEFEVFTHELGLFGSQSQSSAAMLAMYNSSFNNLREIDLVESRRDKSYIQHS